MAWALAKQMARVCYEVVARSIRTLRERGALMRLPKGGLLIVRPDVLQEVADGIEASASSPA